MSRSSLQRLLPLCLALGACNAGRSWKVESITVPVSVDSAFTAAKRALATVGQVNYADADSKSISGECQANVVAAITVQTAADATQVVIKSKMNVAQNFVGIETGKRQGCINRIKEQLRTNGLMVTSLSGQP